MPAQSISAINYSYSNVPGAIGPQNTIAVGNGAATPGAVEILGGVPESRPLDSYQVGVSLSGDPINGIFNPSDFEFNYIHNTSTSTSLHPQGGPFNDSSLLANTSILSTPSDVSSPPGLNWLQDSHANGSFRIIFTGGGASVVNGTMLSMSLVATPLPPAVILFGAGLVALIGLGARNWRQRETA